MKIFNKIMIVNFLLLVLLYLMVAFLSLPFPKVYAYVAIVVLSVFFIARMWQNLVRALIRT